MTSSKYVALLCLSQVIYHVFDLVVLLRLGFETLGGQRNIIVFQW